MLGEFAAPKQFERLALSLSGGGVRAVGFHLGTLDILERLSLLKKVEVLSTVSGGSLVGIGYALSLKKNQSFKKFFEAFFEFLPELKTMEKLVKLKRVKKKSPYHRRTLVRAMAEIYRENYFRPYFGNPRFGIFWEKQPEIHLKDIVFNATDFKTGEAFRFQRTERPSKIGNEEVYLKEDHAKELYMADIMTASACIPGLLEPMFLPYDFDWHEENLEDDIKNFLQEKCNVTLNYVALMDGGVVDNQGISSILRTLAPGGEPVSIPQENSKEQFPSSDWQKAQLWDQQIRSSPRPDLFIISDTPDYRERKKRFFPREGVFGEAANKRLLQRFRKVQNSLPKSEKKSHVQRFWTVLAKPFLNLRLRFYAWLWLVLLVFGIASLILMLLGLHSFWAASQSSTDFFGAFLSSNTESGLSGPLKWSIAAMVLIAIPIMLLNVVSAIVISFSVYQLDRHLGNRLITSKGKSQKKEGSWRRFMKIFKEKESLWHYIQYLKLGELLHMLKLRALSLLRLTGNIYMNRLRQLSYYTAIETPGLKTVVVPNEIFKLKIVNDPDENNTMTRTNPCCAPLQLDINDKMLGIVEESTKMPTQLHLDDPGYQNLRKLVACGQLTTCYNLMEYLWEYHSDGNPENDDPFEASPAAGEIFRNARTLWQQMKNDPYDLVDERLGG